MNAPPTPAETRIAGRYSLEREIGRGGSGVVWLGRDERLGRSVALKRIGLLDGESDVARAEREARLAAQLHHPHVVAVFDAVTEETTGARWLVMEYVDGPSLARLVREQGPLPVEQAAALVGQAAEGLAAAHEAGITHRDVKPSNILVTGRGQVLVTDFGIARVAGDVTITQSGMVTGSPAYLAPEVAAGRRGDQASDVWSLGATLFHLLVGRTPYEIGDNVVGGLYRIVHEEPPRPAAAGWLTPLLEGTMVKDPSLRWTMAQVRDYIAAAGRVQPPGPSLTPPLAGPREIEPDPDTETQVVVPARGSGRTTPRWLVPALVVALLLVVAGGIYAVTRPDDADRQASSGVTPSTSASIEKPTAAGMTAFIRSYVAAISEDPSRSWQMLTPKFKRESGGLASYATHWDGARDGRVLSITADPDNLTVSYQVHFDGIPNGPGPTVLQLAFDRSTGSYAIDGETTRGFTPAGD